MVGVIVYIICTYDVSEKMCNKVMKILRKYLFHIQKSVFEGTLTPKKFNDLQNEIKAVVSKEDSILFFISYNDKHIYKKSINDDIKQNCNILVD